MVFSSCFTPPVVGSRRIHHLIRMVNVERVSRALLASLISDSVPIPPLLRQRLVVSISTQKSTPAQSLILEGECSGFFVHLHKFPAQSNLIQPRTQTDGRDGGHGGAVG